MRRMFLGVYTTDLCPYLEYFACIDDFVLSVVPLVDQYRTPVGDFAINMIALPKTPL